MEITTIPYGYVESFTERDLDKLIDKLTYERPNESSYLIEKNGIVYQRIVIKREPSA